MNVRRHNEKPAAPARDQEEAARKERLAALTARIERLATVMAIMDAVVGSETGRGQTRH